MFLSTLSANRAGNRILHRPQDHLELPFDTQILGVEVVVEKIDLTDRDDIVAVCRGGRERQKILVLDLPLPDPPPEGWKWIEVYRHWARGWR